MKINWGQVLSGIVIVGGVLVGGNGQLSDMGLDPAWVKGIVAFSGLAVAICGGFLTKFQSNYSQAANTGAQPGTIVTVDEKRAPASIIAAAKDDAVKGVELKK
jgi:hypothetical protein